jgi:hypothetical protein
MKGARKQSKDIRRRIPRRARCWEEGKFRMLVQESARSMESFLSTKRGTTAEERAKIFHRKVLRGDA